MLIYVSGSDSLLAKNAIDQIKQKYLAKNPDGAELVEIDETTPNPSWADLAAVPLFATSRLVIVRRAGFLPKAAQQTLAQALSGLASSTVVVVWDGKKIDAPELVAELQKSTKIIDVVTPTGRKLESWIKRRADELGVKSESEVIKNLIADQSVDLWYLETELRQLATGLRSDLQAKTVSEPFVFFSLVRRGDWPAIKRELKDKFRRGEPFELVIGSLAAAVRKELNDEPAARTVTNLLIDIDVALKTGLLDAETAGALLAAELPQPRSNRVQWESSWEGTVS